MLERFVHVSTAYVAGDRVGVVSEHDGNVGQGFRNTYERTKLEAEEIVTDSGLPAAIVRPSVIVGDSATGWTQAFNVIYFPLQAFARGLFPTVPGDPGARLDIVPGRHRRQRAARAAARPGARWRVPRRRGRPGADERASSRRWPPTPSTPSRRASCGLGEDEQAEKRAGALVPYFSVRCTFDARRARDLLGATPPPLAEYFPSLMRYAREASWGKQPSPRWDVALQRAA